MGDRIQYQAFLKKWDITLDANGTNNTYTALGGSKANLTIGQGADATINGVVNLASKTVAVDASGSLTFTGVAAPGSDNTELSKLTAGVIDLNDGFIINLDVDENQTVNAGALLTQDDAEGTTITVATADRIDATVEDGVLTGGDVTVNGSAVAEDDTIRFNIAQTSTDLSKDGIVAEGIYGVSVTTDDKNLNVSYALEGVSINADKTLVFAGQDSDADNSANIHRYYCLGFRSDKAVKTFCIYRERVGRSVGKHNLCPNMVDDRSRRSVGVGGCDYLVALAHSEHPQRHFHGGSAGVEAD